MLEEIECALWPRGGKLAELWNKGKMNGGGDLVRR